MALFSRDKGSKIFGALAIAQPNFRMVATHVRSGEAGPDYVLDEGEKLPSIIEKWQFEPKQEPLSRCGYDYQIEVTNGETTLSVSICFKCKTLVVNHTDKYSITRKQIEKLFQEDFETTI